MKKFFLLLGVLLSVSQLAAQQEWTLVWSDEFNSNGRPDPATWNFEEGFVRNHEAQWYQADNARQEDGLLIIEARREQLPTSPVRSISCSTWHLAATTAVPSTMRPCPCAMR